MIENLEKTNVSEEKLRREISERKQTEKKLLILRYFLETSNRHSDIKSLLNDFISEIKIITSCSAIGIRIMDNEGNIPYMAHNGFSQRFYEMENSLSIKKNECKCTDVIKGQIDYENSIFSENGSFYTNRNAGLLAGTSEEEEKAMQNGCYREGYESMALVPIRAEDRIIGLIHIADFQEDMVPLELVSVIEEIGMILGTAVMRVIAVSELSESREALMKSEERFRTMIEQSPLSIQILDPDGRTIEINRACEELWGITLEDLQGYNILQDKQLEKLGILKYIKRAYSGEAVFVPPVEYDANKTFGKGSSLWVQAYIYPVKDKWGDIRNVVIKHEDITERRRLEREVLEIEESERQRIGHELHDDLGQQLASIAYISQHLEAELQEKSLPLAKDAGKLASLISKANIHVRLMSRGLWPRMEEGGDSVIIAMEELALNTEEIFNIPCTLKCDTPVYINNKKADIHLYRIVQEAVNNAVRHAKPNNIEISLKRENENILITVKDDGTGIRDVSKERNGMGLQIMKYRADMIGASLDIQSDGKNGTIMSCIFNDVRGEI